MAEQEQAIKSTESIYTKASNYNKFRYGVQCQIKDISTCLPVRVVNVQRGGNTGSAAYVDVLPLVTGVAGDGSTVEPTTLYHLPYSRIQGGRAALIIDPEPGDIGIAVFAQSDTSTVKSGTTEPQQPGSLRKFSQSDGWYIGGFLNTAPAVYIELTQNRQIIIQAAGGIQINGDVRVNGDVVANGISLKGHTHPGDSGGTTGVPNG